jgi:hypothetical protein
MGKGGRENFEEYETSILVRFRDSSEAFSLSSSGVQRGLERRSLEEILHHINMVVSIQCFFH